MNVMMCKMVAEGGGFRRGSGQETGEIEREGRFGQRRRKGFRVIVKWSVIRHLCLALRGCPGCS